MYNVCHTVLTKTNKYHFCKSPVNLQLYISLYISPFGIRFHKVKLLVIVNYLLSYVNASFYSIGQGYGAQFHFQYCRGKDV